MKSVVTCMLVITRNVMSRYFRLKQVYIVFCFVRIILVLLLKKVIVTKNMFGKLKFEVT